MEKITYEIEFITPAFIGGANQQAELRPASFVGLLRWWWRVVLASFINDANSIYEWDGKLFGTQDRAGSVFLRLKCERTSKEITEEWNASKGTQYEGKGYMLGMGGRKRSYIKPGTTFKLELIVPNAYKEAVDALVKLSITFGGIGYRGRKGFGSMRITNCDVGHEVLEVSFWRELIKKLGLKETEPNFDLPNLRNLILLKYKYRENRNWDWQKALNELGEIYRRVRLEGKDKTPEYESCIYYFLRKKRINFEKVNFANLPFGLPIMFQSKTLRVEYKDTQRKDSPTKYKHAQAQLTWIPLHKEKPNEDKSDTKRRASSILFNVKKDGIYALAFKCKFLPEGSKLHIHAKGDYWKLKGEPKPKPININFDEKAYENMFEQVIQRLKKAGFEEVKI